MRAYTHTSLLILVAYVMLLCSCEPGTAKVTDTKNAQKKAELKIEYLAHASFLLHYEGTTLLIDPYADTTWLSYFFPRDIVADAVISTHPHYDHDGGIFRDLKPWWQGKLPFYQDPGKYTIGSFEIQGVKGRHCDPYGKEFGQKNTIFIFEVGGLRIAHWGDNAPINDTLARQLDDIDILMLPIDDTFHILSEEETAMTIERINPRLVIPMHYRINELEPLHGKPRNLGSIDQYFSNRTNKTVLTGNTAMLNKDDLPAQMRYMIFKHSPKVTTITQELLSNK